MEDKNENSFLEKFNFSKKLSVKIITIISIVVVIGMIGLGYLINDTAADKISGMARTRNNDIAELLQSEINGFLNNGKSIIEFASDQDSFKNNNVEEMTTTFNNILANYDQFKNVYFGAADGEMHIKPDQTLPGDYDPRQRPWYKNSIKTDEIV
jgi:methyl-accepting chemotaxis protein